MYKKNKGLGGVSVKSLHANDFELWSPSKEPKVVATIAPVKRRQGDSCKCWLASLPYLASARPIEIL